MKKFERIIPYEPYKAKGIDIEGWLGPIQRMQCELVADISAASYPITREDFLARLINEVTIRASGARTFFDIGDGRLWKYLNGEQENPILLDPLLKPGERKRIYLDLPVYLPNGTTINPRELTNLRMDISWNSEKEIAEGHLSNGYIFPPHLIINFAYLKFIAYYNEKKPSKVKRPSYEWVNFNFKEAEELDFSLPVGDILDKTLMMALNKDDNRDDKVIEKMQITLRDDVIHDQSWDSWVEHHPTSQGPTPGLTLIDWSKEPKLADAQKRLRGEVKLLFKAKNQGSVKILTVCREGEGV